MFHNKPIDEADCQSCHSQIKCDTGRQATLEYQGWHLDDSADRCLTVMVWKLNGHGWNPHRKHRHASSFAMWPLDAAKSHTSWASNFRRWITQTLAANLEKEQKKNKTKTPTVRFAYK